MTTTLLIGTRGSARGHLERILSGRFAITVASRVKKGERKAIGEAREEAKRVVTALRLLHSGGVSCNISFTDVTGFHPNFKGLVSAGTAPLVPQDRSPREFHLCAEECDALKARWESLVRLSGEENRGGLAVAVRKFDDACSRWSREDMIIDMAVLLESTLLHKIKDELIYRLALRGAILLKTTRAPVETHELLKAFYNIRSRIVHDGKKLAPLPNKLKSDFTPDAFIVEMQSICREVLVAFIDEVTSGGSISQVTDDLDEQALRGEGT